MGKAPVNDILREDIFLSAKDWQAVSNSLNDAVLVLDRDNRVLTVNASAIALFGYEREELVGRKFMDSDILDAESRKALLAETKNISVIDRVKSSTCQFMHKDGKTFAGLVRVVPLAANSKAACAVSIRYGETGHLQTEEKLKYTATLLETQQETALDGILVVDENGKIISYNQQFIEIWNLPEEIVESRSNEKAIQYVSDNVRNSEEANALVRHLYGHSNQKSHDEISLKDGRILDRYSAPMFSKDGQYYGRVWYFRDITEYRQAEQKTLHANIELTQTINKLKEKDLQNSILSEMREMIQACSSLEEIPVIIRGSMTRLFPHASGAFFMAVPTGTELELALHWNNFPDDIKNTSFEPDACWSFRRGRVHLVEATAIDPVCTHLKNCVKTAYACIPLIAKGETLGLLHLQVNPDAPPEFQEKTALNLKEISATIEESLPLSIANIKLSEELRMQTVKDPLTGLYNRRYMLESLRREILHAEREKAPISIVMMDIDHFKRFNDTNGHGAGDELLRKVGNFLKSSIRGSDVACRYGGEEFILFLPESTAGDTLQRMKKILKAIAGMEVFYYGKQLESVTLSMGIATYPDHGTEGETLLKLADAALYRAKQEGRNRIVVGDAAGQKYRPHQNTELPSVRTY